MMSQPWRWGQRCREEDCIIWRKTWSVHQRKEWREKTGRDWTSSSEPSILFRCQVWISQILTRIWIFLKCPVKGRNGGEDKQWQDRNILATLFIWICKAQISQILTYIYKILRCKLWRGEKISSSKPTFIIEHARFK